MATTPPRPPAQAWMNESLDMMRRSLEPVLVWTEKVLMLRIKLNTTFEEEKRGKKKSNCYRSVAMDPEKYSIQGTDKRERARWGTVLPAMFENDAPGLETLTSA